MQVFEALRDLPSTVRVTDMPAYIRGFGYSTDGVIIKTFLGTPMRHRGEHLGNFFLAEKQTGPEFTDDGENVLPLFASQAAAATANARTHRDERRARADPEALVETSPLGAGLFDGGTDRAVSPHRQMRRFAENLQTPGRSCEQPIEAISFRLAEGRAISPAKFPQALQLSDPQTLRAEQLTLSVPDPRSVTALVSATPIRDEDGDLVSLVVTLQELERLRAEFLGMLSYERRARRGPTARRMGSAPACVAPWQRPPSSASPCDTLRPFTRRPASRPRGAQARRAARGPHPPQTEVITMQIHLLGLSAALIASLLVSPSLAQQQSKQQQQQIKRDLKAQQKAEEDADKRQELLQEVQPLADRFAEAMLTRKYSDSLVQGYLGSLGQSLVPPETPASTTFSFRVVQDIVPNAYALPDGRIYITTGMLAHVENEAQLAMVLGHEIGHVIEEHALESLRRQRSGQRRNKIVGAAAGAALGGVVFHIISVKQRDNLSN